MLMLKDNENVVEQSTVGTSKQPSEKSQFLVHDQVRWHGM